MGEEQRNKDNTQSRVPPPNQPDNGHTYTKKQSTIPQPPATLQTPPNLTPATSQTHDNVQTQGDLQTQGNLQTQGDLKTSTLHRPGNTPYKTPDNTLDNTPDKTPDKPADEPADITTRKRRKVGLFDRHDEYGRPIDPDFYTWSNGVGWSILIGNGVGAFIGYHRGQQPAHDTLTMYSGVMHPEDVYLRIRRIRSNYIWLTAFKYSALSGITTGIFTGIYLGMQRYRQKSDVLNLSVAGLVTGCIITSPMSRQYGILPIAMGAVIGGTLGVSGGLLEAGVRFLAKYNGLELDFRSNPIQKPKEQSSEQKSKNGENSVTELHKT